MEDEQWGNLTFDGTDLSPEDLLRLNINSIVAFKSKTKEHLTKLNDSTTGNVEWRKNHSALLKERYKDSTKNPCYRGPVVGTNIKTGETITLAGKREIKEAGFTPTHVYTCANDIKLYKGYTWRWDQDDLQKPYHRGSVIGTNIKTGETITLTGSKEIKEAGFSPGCVYNCANDKKSHKGYTWRREQDDLQKERDPTKTLCYRGPVIGTNIKTGEIIVLANASEVKEAGFNRNNIGQCINGKRRSHKGYTWRREPLDKSK